MTWKIFLPILLIFLVAIPYVNAETTPDWVKNTAGWWATDAISETEFVNAIEFLVNNQIIQVSSSQSTDNSQGVPDWVKNTAGWWATDAISETEFVNAIEFLVKNGIINVETKSTESNILQTTSFFETEVEYIPKPANAPELYTMNSEGFRGPDFIKKKPDDIYRIIAIGGSTTFGAGVTDENTWPNLLEKKLQSIDRNKKIEVINAGTAGLNSLSENKLVKERLIHYEPNLIIFYEGHNDVGCGMPEHITKNHIQTKEKKIKNCGVYDPENYQKVFGDRWSKLCDWGEENGFKSAFILQPFVDFGKILTDHELNQYFLRPENSAYLNSLERMSYELDEIQNHCAAVADYRGVFDNYFEPIYYDYVHTGSRGNVILADEISGLISPILYQEEIIDRILEPSNIDSPIKNSELMLQLYESNWGAIPQAKQNFVGQNLSGSDFSNSNLENSIFFAADLRNANFENSVLSGSDFSLANLENANFKNAVIDGIKLRQTNLEQTNFSNVDFTQVNLENVDLTDSILKNSNLSKKDLTKTFLLKADLTGADLSGSNLELVYFKDTVLKDADLSGSMLYETDLSLALNKDLSGTRLTNAAITWGNHVGVDFSNKDLSFVNCQNCNLSFQDFTNNVNFEGTDFSWADLSNANFSGVDLTPQSLYQQIIPGSFSNNDELRDLVYATLGESAEWDMTIVHAESDGKQIFLEYHVSNHFYSANLQNANFQNSKLISVDFVDADLSNANFSGANLQNANFSGANLQDALLDGAKLDCLNHEICN